MPAQDQRDEEMAHKYGISVEVLREGIPRRLQRFPDGQIVFGDRLCVRIATAKQLEETLDLVDSSAVIGRPPYDLDIYIVPYLPPSETVELRQLWLQRVEGAPNVALHSMNILEAKEEVLDLITQKITAVNELIGQLQNLADRLMLHKNPAGNAHLFSLKIRYVLCKIRSDDMDTAKALLNDVPEIEGNAADFGHARILEVANELSELYLADHAENEVSDEIVRLILAEVSSTDWRDKMQLINNDPRLLECIEDTISELRRRVTLYEEISTEPSLIGASHADFGEL